jgi:hypothetical protein
MQTEKWQKIKKIQNQIRKIMAEKESTIVDISVSVINLWGIFPANIKRTARSKIKNLPTLFQQSFQISIVQVEVNIYHGITDISDCFDCSKMMRLI